MATKRKYPRELKLDLVRQCFEGVKEVTEVAVEEASSKMQRRSLLFFTKSLDWTR